jgi:hypothetical protein
MVGGKCPNSGGTIAKGWRAKTPRVDRKTVLFDTAAKVLRGHAGGNTDFERIPTSRCGQITAKRFPLQTFSSLVHCKKKGRGKAKTALNRRLQGTKSLFSNDPFQTGSPPAIFSPVETMNVGRKNRPKTCIFSPGIVPRVKVFTFTCN